ncbi:MAG: 3-deoxy-8-phosphooctulonate synthase [Phycisphaerae bacterium]
MSIEPVSIGPFSVGAEQPLVLIAGPCVIESTDHCLRVAEQARDVARRLGVPYIFKASFDKANRTSVAGFRGPGLESGLRTLATVRERIGVPVLSDIHDAGQARAAGDVLDVVQIPAFLCRQTDLIVAAARTGKPVNIKKGQFMSPAQMRQAVEKARQAGNARVLLTERGTFFGYGALVNDMTAIPIMREFAPVVFDATHSCQTPGSQETQTGGRPQFTSLLARCAITAGADALFLEVHDDPSSAKSDAATLLPITALESLLSGCLKLRGAL